MLVFLLPTFHPILFSANTTVWLQWSCSTLQASSTQSTLWRIGVACFKKQSHFTEKKKRHSQLSEPASILQKWNPQTCQITLPVEWFTKSRSHSRSLRIGVPIWCSQPTTNSMKELSLSKPFQTSQTDRSLNLSSSVSRTVLHPSLQSAIIPGGAITRFWLVFFLSLWR